MANKFNSVKKQQPGNWEYPALAVVKSYTMLNVTVKRGIDKWIREME